MKMRKHKPNNDGSALIPVLCMICVFMALILSLILTSYQVLSHAQKAATKEQCRIGALSFSEALKKELAAPGNGTIAEGIAGQIASKTWEYYNESEGKDKKVKKQLSVNLNETEMRQYGTFEVEAYWKGDLLAVQTGNYSNIELVITTTCKLRKQSFSVTATYKPSLGAGGSFADISTWMWIVQ